MFKKIFSLSILFCTFIFTASAADLPKCPTYLDPDKNYILYADLGIHGAGLYVDRHTCGIAEESSSEFIILVDTVEVPDAALGKTRIFNRFCHRYKFDLLHGLAYRYELFNNQWIKLDPYITNIEDDDFTYDVAIAEMAYYLARGEKFFGALNKARFDVVFYDNLVAS